MPMKKPRVLLGTVIGALTVAGTAGGFIAGRVVTARPGDRADLPTRGAGVWSCFNHGTYVECGSGDAFPYVELTTSQSAGVTVKVHTLRGPQGGHVTRTYEKGYPVYVFTAF
jgi:hypothetical protein